MTNKSLYFDSAMQVKANAMQQENGNEIRYVRVFDKKTSDEIATFTNEPANEIESQKELMISPTISRTSNGESTLSFQMFANSQKWQDIKDPENIYECNGRYYTALNEQSITYLSQDGETIVEAMLVETWYLLKKKFVQVHNVDTKIEALDEHTVKILPKTKPEFKLTVNGIAYDDSEIKDNRGVLMPRGSAGYALWGLLKDTGWSLGICDVLPDGFDATKDYGTFNVESDMKSVLENIQFVQELYGGILVWDSKNKTCSLRDEKKESDFNEWKGVSFEEGKNLSEAPKIVWDNNIVTRLYPLGNGNLNIKRVNGGKSYIDNFSYTSKIYEAYLQNANIYDTNDEGGQKTLKRWAESKLQSLCKPRKSITYSVIDMRATKEYSFEDFDVDDIVLAYYKDQSGKLAKEFLRIQSISYNYFYPSSQTTVEVGDKIANEAELFLQIYKKSNNSAPTDSLGNLSGFDININIPEWWLDEFLNKGIENNLNNLIAFQAVKTTENSKAISGVKAYADNNFASLELFTSYSKQTNEKIVQSNTKITSLSNELNAQIKLEANHYKQTKGEIVKTNTTISQISDDLNAQIKLEASHYKQTKDGLINTKATITQVANKLNSQIKLEASHYSNTSNSIASLTVVANQQGSSITAQANQINLIANEVNVQGKLIANKASISDLNVTNGWIHNLEAETARINQVVATKVSASEVDAKFLTASDIGSQSGYLTIGNGRETGVYGDLRCNGTVYGRLESANGSSETVYIIGKNDNYEIYFNRGIFTGWNKA